MQHDPRRTRGELGERIAELAVDGDADHARLEQVATEIADLCLVGWDTGGEAWEP